MGNGLTRGQLAKQGQVKFETVRFYEHEGLLPPPPRSSSGYRNYPATAVRRLQFIRSAKELGFSLSEIREMLDIRVDPDHFCTDAVKHIEIKVTEIDEKIRNLKAIRNTLNRLKKSCSGHCRVTECPILDSLDRRKQ